MAMDADLRTRLEKMLALTKNNPNEYEAAQAMDMLQRLLIKHNLDIAELETRGNKAPQIGKKAHDLGKAAWKWKMDLAETIANHYFCYPIIDRHYKTVNFVGRPDNVESLEILYKWLIDQIVVISREARRDHLRDTGEHIDPLRWQLAFGVGVVERLTTRLREIVDRRVQDNKMHALVLHHQTEISDYLEETMGYRIDGQPTKQQREWQKKYDERIAYPHYRPPSAEQLAKWEADSLKLMKKHKPRKQRVYYRTYTEADAVRDDQQYTAKTIGRRSGDKVNLEPFLTAGEKGK
jgi:hypothetical protein